MRMTYLAIMLAGRIRSKQPLEDAPNLIFYFLITIHNSFDT